MGATRNYGRVALFAAAAWTAGCSSGPDLGAIDLSPDQRHAVARQTPAATGPVRLPEERPFNVHLKNSSQNPGFVGHARGESDANGGGDAHAQAHADHGGSAAAEFTLGHRFEHAADVVHTGRIDVVFDLEQTVQASSPPEQKTAAVADLQLLVIDAHRREVAKIPLVQTTSDEVITQGNTHIRRRITLRLEPHLSYSVVLFAQVTAATGGNQQARAELRVRGLNLQISVLPAQTQPAGS